MKVPSFDYPIEPKRSAQPPVRVVMVGCGGMALAHMRTMLLQDSTTEIAGVCEPSEHAYAALCTFFAEHGKTPPPNEPNLEVMLERSANQFDAAFIITPHAMHHKQAVLCMEAGLDVLLEKPMTITADEAIDLIRVRDRTGRLLVVSFNGSLSPQIRTAARMLRADELGPILNIHGTVWQNWRTITHGKWRQVPEMSGGGFFFDTGAHLLNTVADLAGEDFAEVSAQFDNHGAAVDITGAAMARLNSGAFVTLNACGDTIKSCASDVRVFCRRGILRTGVWGERLQVQREGQMRLMPVRVRRSLGAWEQFMRVRRGEMTNPSPPEVGLRMAHLWDAMRASAAKGGQPVAVAPSRQSSAEQPQRLAA